MTSMILLVVFCICLIGGIVGVVVVPTTSILAITVIVNGAYVLVSFGLYMRFSVRVKHRLAEYKICMNYKPFVNFVIANFFVILFSMGMATMPVLMNEALPWVILGCFVIAVSTVMRLGSFSETRSVAVSYVYFSERGVHFGNDLPNYYVITWEDCSDLGVGVARTIKTQKEVLYFSRSRLDHPEFLSRGNMMITDSFIAIDLTKHILSSLLRYKTMDDIRNKQFLPRSIANLK